MYLFIFIKKKKGFSSTVSIEVKDPFDKQSDKTCEFLLSSGESEWTSDEQRYTDSIQCQT